MKDLKESIIKDGSWIFDLRNCVGIENKSQISFVGLVDVSAVDSEGNMAFVHVVNLVS